MKKKALVAAVAVLLSFTACGRTENSETSENEVSLISEIETTVPETEEPTEADEDSAEESEEEVTEESAAVIDSEEFTPVAGLSENYADFENRKFAYNGQIFTLGESTLQDLIDGGIPFDENELNNVGNNVNKNHESDRYNIKINDYVNMQFVFINTTDTNITEAECLLNYVRWYPLYVPQPDYDDSLNKEIIFSINDAANYVCFSFPLTLTKEQLLKNNIDVTEVTESNCVNYRIESEVYMGDSGYHFEFNDKTNQLEEVDISWLP